MSMMIAEIYEALVEAGTSEEKAKAAACVVPVIDSLATKTDLQELRSGMKADMQVLRSEMQAELKVLKFAVFSLYSICPCNSLQNFFLNHGPPAIIPVWLEIIRDTCFL